jgi:hypothetical protein
MSSLFPNEVVAMPAAYQAWLSLLMAAMLMVGIWILRSAGCMFVVIVIFHSLLQLFSHFHKCLISRYISSVHKSLLKNLPINTSGRKSVCAEIH